MRFFAKINAVPAECYAWTVPGHGAWYPVARKPGPSPLLEIGRGLPQAHASEAWIELPEGGGFGDDRPVDHGKQTEAAARARQILRSQKRAIAGTHPSIGRRRRPPKRVTLKQAIKPFQQCHRFGLSAAVGDGLFGQRLDATPSRGKAQQIGSQSSPPDQLGRILAIRRRVAEHP
jgi:hypothetical protein